jgi:hypothetical protein
MTVVELMDTLKQYDPSVDVVIAATPYGEYFNFRIKEQKGLTLREGEPSGVVTFEIGDEISQYRLVLQD